MRPRTLIPCLILLLTTAVPMLHAAVIPVNTTSALEFQAALDTAAANGEDDTINVAANTFHLASPLHYDSGEDHSLTIQGAGAGLTVLDGTSTTQILHVATTGDHADITVRGITFRNGHTDNYGGGAELQTFNASILVEDCAFEDNVAAGTPDVTGVGGGLAATANAGNVTLNRMAFSRNVATNDGGGATLWSDSGLLSISDCTFEDNNTDTGDDAGGLSAQTITGTIELTGSTFTNNRAGDDGGGVMLYATGAGASLRVDNNTFTSNRAQLNAGGLYVRTTMEATVTVANNSFDGNTCVENGAGVHIELEAGALTLEANTYRHNSTSDMGGEPDGGGLLVTTETGAVTVLGDRFIENEAGRFGGGANVLVNRGTLFVANSLFAGNSAVEAGGGLQVASDTGVLRLVNNTFEGNTAADAGGLGFYSETTNLTVLNQILWNNTPNAMAAVGPGAIQATYSDVQGGWPGVGNIDVDPLFVGVADYHLQDASPCIDAGLMGLDVPATDIEGTTRPTPAGSTPDLGAYENERGTPLRTNRVRNPMAGLEFPTLHEALADPSTMPGTTLLMSPGTYVENVTVDVTYIRIQPEEDAAPGSVILQAANPSAPVMTVIGDEVEVTGLTFTGADTLEPGAPTAGIYLYGVRDGRFRENRTTGNYDGIYADDILGCEFTDNVIESNAHAGVYLWQTLPVEDIDRNLFTGNTIRNNRYGVMSRESGNNLIFLNDLVANTENVNCLDGTNLWSSLEPITYFHDGVVGESRLGNYWSDYAGTDADHDGIGDTPYPIANDDDDLFPLVGSMTGYVTDPAEIPRRIRNINTNERFITFQAALDDPDTLSGHTLVAASGEYTENVRVEKSVTILSESGDPGDTLVRALDADRAVFEVLANDVRISGFTLTGSTRDFAGAGVNLFRTSDCIVSNNVLHGNWYGVSLNMANRNQVIGNEMRDNDDGVFLYESSDNRIEDNLITGNQDKGISLDQDSASNRIARNEIGSNHNHGLHLWRHSSDNGIYQNVIRDNGIGLYLSEVVGNLIFLNTFLTNTAHLSIPADGPSTRWYTPTEVDYTYRGSAFTGYLGNYWDDFLTLRPGTLDADSNGVWDAPHPIDHDEDDLYPLADPLDEYSFFGDPLPGVVIFPPRVDFRTVVVGEISVPHVVTVTNIGDVPLSIDSLAIEGADAAQFEIDAESCSGAFPPGATCNLNLVFHPDSAGMKSAELVLTISGHPEPFRIPLVGIGAQIPLLQTGQKSCYTESGVTIPHAEGPGQDGSVQAGFRWDDSLTARFRDNHDGTVTDRLTGLMWLKDANCIETHHPDIDLDGVTGDGQVNWDTASWFVDRMNDGTFADCNAGYTDWQLPDVRQLESLLNLDGRSDSWLGSIFDNMLWEAAWSSTEAFGGSGGYWVVHIRRGEVQYESSTGFRSVLPVRIPDTIADVPVPLAAPDGGVTGIDPASRFEAYPDWIVDRVTGLMWLRDLTVVGTGIRWEEAIQRANDLALGGYDDWRLANVRELRSLIDYTVVSPADLLAAQGFTGIGGGTTSLWSSTTVPGGGHTLAFRPNLADGYETLASKDGAGTALAVRAGLLTDGDLDDSPDWTEWGPDGTRVGYDGNSDGIPDSEQSNVVSLATYDGDGYVTIESPEGTVLVDVAAVETPPSPPEGADLPWGMFRFTVENLRPGADVIVRIYLDDLAAPPESYYKHGPTPGRPVPHWYAFRFDGTTGAEISGRTITLHLVDGDRGDSDLLANGRIVEPGGPGTAGTAPGIQTTPQGADFGSVAPGTTSQPITFSVTNVGTTDLVLGAIQITGTDAGDFRLLQDGASGQTIPPGENRNFQVAFAPKTAGWRDAELTIPSNDPFQPTLRLALTGTGLLVGDVSENGEVSAFDAALLLQYLVGSANLTQPQLRAADTSGDTQVDAYDASLILQYVVGLISQFQTGSTQAPSIADLARTVSLASQQVRGGTHVRVPLRIDDPADVLAGEFEIRFDPTALRFVQVESPFAVESRAEEGTLKLVFAGAASQTRKQLALLEFEILPEAFGNTAIRFERGVLNGKTRARLQDAQITFVPSRSALLPNYPNPFNPETWIPYALAGDTEVVIRIHDITGACVREFSLGQRRAGYYVSKDRALYWDGRNDLGERVASGVYFYTIRTRDFTATRRLLVVK